MIKLLLILTTTVIFLTSQETSGELFLLKPEYKKISINGQTHFAFDVYNAKILVAKHAVITNLFMPVTNCQYSNLIKIEKKSYQIEQDNYTLKRKNIKKNRIIAILSAVIVVLIVTK